MKKTLSMIMALAMVVAMFAMVMPASAAPIHQTPAVATVEVTVGGAATTATGYFALKPNTIYGNYIPKTWVTTTLTLPSSIGPSGLESHFYNGTAAVILPAVDTGTHYVINLQGKNFAGDASSTLVEVAIPKTEALGQYGTYSYYIDSQVAPAGLAATLVQPGAGFPVYTTSSATPFYVRQDLGNNAGAAGQYQLYAVKLLDSTTPTGFATDLATATANHVTLAAAAATGTFGAYAYRQVTTEAYTFNTDNGVKIAATQFANLTTNDAVFTSTSAPGASFPGQTAIAASEYGSFYAFVLVQSAADGSVSMSVAPGLIAIQRDGVYSEITVPETFTTGYGKLFTASFKKSSGASNAWATLTNVATGATITLTGALTVPAGTAVKTTWNGITVGGNMTTWGAGASINLIAPDATYRIVLYDGTAGDLTSKVVYTGFVTTTRENKDIVIAPTAPANAPGAGMTTAGIFEFFKGTPATYGAFEQITLTSTFAGAKMAYEVYSAADPSAPVVTYPVTTSAYATYPTTFNVYRTIQNYASQYTMANGLYSLRVVYTDAAGVQHTSNNIKFAVGTTDTAWTAITPSATTIEVPTGVVVTLSDVLSFTAKPDAQTTAGFNTFYDVLTGAKFVDVTSSNANVVVLNGTHNTAGAPQIVVAKAGNYELTITGNMNALTQVSTKVKVVAKELSGSITVDTAAIRLDGSADAKADTTKATIKATYEAGKVVLGTDGRVGITFTSLDESVATVDANGVVTAVGEGSTKITVATKHPSASYEVSVTVCPPVTGMLYLPSNEGGIFMRVGQIKMSRAYITPTGAYDRTVTYSSDNLAVAYVLPDGNVIGVGAGKAILTATSNAVTGVSQTVEVTVI